MRLPEGEWLVLEEVASTQDVAAKLVREGRSGVVLAKHQKKGKGRLGRSWFGGESGSLAASIVFSAYADHRQPWLVGMAMAAAAAGAIHCRLRWPNDLIIEGRKVGGVLTELLPDPDGRLVPLVGLGVNIGPLELPRELSEVATCISDHQKSPPSAEHLLSRVLDRAAYMPEPESWPTIEPIWRLYDDTPGKQYRMPNGEAATALGIGGNGELIASLEGATISVMAAEAIFGAISETKDPRAGSSAVPFSR